jgi:calcineurin-like phosphoesterase family protein
VTGNHDKKSASWYLSHNWDMVCESFTLFAFGKRILFSHKPLPVTFSSGIDLNIHGHFHDFSLEKIQTEEPHLAEFVGDKKHFLISLEKLNYAPVKLKHIITLFSEQENKKNV